MSSRKNESENDSNKSYDYDLEGAYESNQNESEINYLKNEIKKKNDIIDAYTNASEDFQQLHEKLRAEITKRSELEIAKETLKNRLKQSQSLNKTMKKSLKEYKEIYEKQLNDLETKHDLDIKELKAQKDEEINQLYTELSLWRADTQISDFLHHASRKLRKQFESLDDLLDFLTLEKLNDQANSNDVYKTYKEEIDILSRKITKSRTKYHLVSETVKDQHKDIKKLKKSLKEAIAQNTKLESIKQTMLHDSQVEIESLKSEKHSLETKILSLENSIKTMKTEKEDAETKAKLLINENKTLSENLKNVLKSNAADADFRMAAAAEEAEKFGTQLEKLQKEVEKANEGKKRLENELQRLADRAKGALDQREQLKAESALQKARISELEAQTVRLTSELSRAELEHVASIGDRKEMKIITPNSNIENIAKEIESSLKDEITKAFCARDQMAVAILKQNQLMRMLEEKYSQELKNAKRNAYKEIFENVIKPSLQNNERAKEILNGIDSDSVKLQKILNIPHQSEIRTVPTLTKPDSYRNILEMNQEELEEKFQSVMKEGITSQANFISSLVAAIEHQKEEIQQLRNDLQTAPRRQNIDALKDELAKLASRVEIQHQKRQKTREIASNLRDELKARIMQNQKLQNELREVKAKVEAIQEESKIHHQTEREVRKLQAELVETKQELIQTKAALETANEELNHSKEKKLTKEMHVVSTELTKERNKVKILQSKYEQLEREYNYAKGIIKQMEEAEQSRSHTDIDEILRKHTEELEKREKKIRDVENRLRIEAKKHAADIKALEEQIRRVDVTELNDQASEISRQNAELIERLRESEERCNSLRKDLCQIRIEKQNEETKKVTFAYDS